jgi:DNA polymerase III epsilon subunit-like protein
MYTKPSTLSRHVVIDIKTVSNDPNDPEGALSAFTGRAVCICLMIDDGTELEELSLTDVDESVLLSNFWQILKMDDVLIGHNIMEFALPFLRQRSWIHDIIPSRHIDLRRFYDHEVIDVAQLWSTYGSTKKPSLDRLAQALDLSGAMAHGIQVCELWAAGERESVIEHCRDDVRIAFQAFLRLSFQSLPDRYYNSTFISLPYRAAPDEVLVRWD